MHSYIMSCFSIKQLPTAEHEEEKAKGSFYFKVFGKELFYNYFTYDDVKELIEDGVIRVSNDLKDLLKKGWEKMNRVKDKVLFFFNPKWEELFDENLLMFSIYMEKAYVA